MQVQWWFDQGKPAGAAHVSRLTVTPYEWRQAAEDMAAGGGRLLALWATLAQDGTNIVRAAYTAEPGLLIVSLPLTSADTRYPGIENLFPAAQRMQRAAADLSGVRSTDMDSRPWLRHAKWRASYHPLTPAQEPAGDELAVSHDYPFVRVEGEGVHEIPVGPVHAGIIEPGHFRFSIVGEKVLRLEERLGYVHKGIEQRFTQLPIEHAHKLAARVSGDSAVAFSWAYCQALESLSGTVIPARAAWLRALALELERMANHLGDLGALGNDAGFAFGLAQFSRLKEQLLRANHQAFGQRYLMDFIAPGGTSADIDSTGVQVLATSVASITGEADDLRKIYDEHAGVRDRFAAAGVVTPQLAARLGLTGLAGRASGQAFDLRVDMPCEPYTEVALARITRQEGDVAARVAVRFDELMESARLVQLALKRMPRGPHHAALGPAEAGAEGFGLIEGWRGPVFIALEAGPQGTIRRCHAHDPSWQNWPVLEHAIIGNIVPDFPLINKSFNLSYSGHDL